MAAIVGHIQPEETWRMEQFSRAYVKAIASVAACNVEWATVDNDSVDGTLRRRTINTPIRSPRLDLQLKATSQDCIREHHVAFTLSMKNYNDLRATNLAVPRILVVAVLPADIADWTQHSEAQLALRKCGYWMTLRGEPDVANEVTRTVSLPRHQVFDAAGLNAMFARLEQGQLP